MEYDELKHFEKLLDEFEEDVRAATYDGEVPPSASKRHQRDLTRRNVLAFVEELAIRNVKDLDAAVESSKNEDRLRKERNLLHKYLCDAMIGMSPYALSVTSRWSQDYCEVIIDKAHEYKP